MFYYYKYIYFYSYKTTCFTKKKKITNCIYSPLAQSKFPITPLTSSNYSCKLNNTKLDINVISCM